MLPFQAYGSLIGSCSICILRKGFHMLRQIAPAFRMTLLFTVLTGLIYPGVVTALCQLLFSHQANGSLVSVNGRIAGSTLLGQNFAKPEYFHPRPSAAGSNGYDASGSAASNLGPTNQKLITRVRSDVAKFYKENAPYQGPVPADAVTTSASGLDPDISPAFAEAQARPRCRRARPERRSSPKTSRRSHQETRTRISWRASRECALVESRPR